MVHAPSFPQCPKLCWTVIKSITQKKASIHLKLVQSLPEIKKKKSVFFSLLQMKLKRLHLTWLVHLVGCCCQFKSMLKCSQRSTAPVPDGTMFKISFGCNLREPSGDLCGAGTRSFLLPYMVNISE